MLTLPLLIASLFTACGEKEATETAAPAEAATTESSVVPADKNSQAFAESLFAEDFEGMKPVEGDGVVLTYKRLSFNPDGSWKAEGVVEVMDEGMECVESGSWSMEPADSKSVGTVSWDLEKTNCAGRESGGTTRAEFSFDGGDYSMKMR
ncbi:MAG: hypothetical protein VX899_05080 [Myxococcota bacterium]|nr:hypothetical protein [Myxococcota bacterium]